MALDDIIELVQDLGGSTKSLTSQAVVREFAGEYAEAGISASSFLSDLRQAGVHIANETFADIYSQFQDTSRFISRLQTQSPDEQLRDSLFAQSPYDQTDNYRYFVRYYEIDNQTQAVTDHGYWLDSATKLAPNEIISLVQDTIDEFRGEKAEPSDVSFEGFQLTGAWAINLPTSDIL